MNNVHPIFKPVIAHIAPPVAPTLRLFEVSITIDGETHELNVLAFTSFVAFTDDSVSREQTARAFWLHMSMIHGIVVERIFLPVAERLAKQDHDEKTWALGCPPVQIANSERAERLAA